MARLAVLSLILLLTGASAASASTARRVVTSESGARGEVRSAAVIAEGAPGEGNRLTVRRDGRAVIVHDAGAPLTAGAGCTALGRATARCDGPDLATAVRVSGGDGDDTLTAETDLAVVLEGGPGDDVLTGNDSEHNDVLRGDEGADVLHGREGFDTLTGGAGDDRLMGGPGTDLLIGDGADAPPGDDVIDGGPGYDTAGYAEREAPVRVDLSTPAPSGGAGEADLLREVEGVDGGQGADTLVGNAEGNVLEGGGGNDRLSGGARSDSLEGGSGHDRLAGGTGPDSFYDGLGDDRILGGPGADAVFLQEGADTVGCGAGVDIVRDPRAADTVALECDRLRTAALDLRIGAAGPAALSLALDGRYILRCTGSFRLRGADGRALDQRRFRIRREDRLRVRLEHGRAAVQEALGVHVSVRPCDGVGRRSMRFGVAPRGLPGPAAG